MAVNLIKQNDEYGRLEHSNNNLLTKYDIRGDSLRDANSKIDSLQNKKPSNVNTFLVIKEEELETEEPLEQPTGKTVDNVGNKDTSDNKNQQIVSDIDSVITNLENLIKSKDFTNLTVRKRGLNNVKTKLDNLSSKDKNNKNTYQSIRKELSNEKVENSKSNDVKNIINSQIKKLNKIKHNYENNNNRTR
jgi:hypothetical protein